MGLLCLCRNEIGNVGGILGFKESRGEEDGQN
jgi:hypothetical protein